MDEHAFKELKKRVKEHLNKNQPVLDKETLMNQSIEQAKKKYRKKMRDSERD
ncbi:hypothetical protein ACFFJI_12760 [Allobacillus sp. GCM10007491]|uniref:Uncharacterized protein n=1 Tax=Allobacillus saliphilus TaxID=2912308 RepID=A0A941HTY7_9BACI|nr:MULTISPECIES: hypothetical protein [Allobacillus]MBR7554407.1 hypothetical protein [Allobacillus saliphilus]